MISTVEKVLFLKSIDLFSQIPGEDLAQVALISATQAAAVITTIQEAARNGDIETPRSVLSAFETEVASLKEDLRCGRETS